MTESQANQEAARYAETLTGWADDAGDNAPEFSADCRAIAAMITGHVQAYAELIRQKHNLEATVHNMRKTIGAQQEVIHDLNHKRVKR